MQPTPTSSLLARSAPRLRAWTLSFHTALFAGLLVLGACRDPKVTSYQVPKEPAAELPASKPVNGMGATATAEVAPTPASTAAEALATGTPALPSEHPALPGSSGALPPNHPATGGAAGGPALQTASGQSLTWSAPAGWQAKPASMMRKATYAISGGGGVTADLAITAFPGDVGGDVANVNRWRGQVGLPEVSDATALGAIERLEANGLKIGLVDVVDRSASNPTHLIGAIVPFEGATWFFKLLGPDSVVAANKAAFVEFVKTIKPAAPTAP